MTRWDEKYRDGYAAGGTPEALIVEAVKHVVPGFALDLACGRGRNAIYLSAQGWQVTALDSSQVALSELPRTIHAAIADLESPDFQLLPDTYDLICDCYYLYRPLFPQIRSALRSGGLFVAVIAMIDDDPAVPPMNPAYLCQPNELRSLFANWEIRHSEEIKPGPFRRRVAELIARKPS